MILYAIRHDRTALPPGPGGPTGRLDVPLVGTHEAAAACVLAALATSATSATFATFERGGRPSHVWTSPLSRCALTARLVADALGVPCMEDPRLLELSYGDWEGRAWDELPRAACDAWMRDWQEEGPPGGDSAHALERRVASWLEELGRRGQDPSLACAAQLLVGHAGVIRALRVLLRQPAAPAITWPDAMAAPVPYASDPDAMAVFEA